MHENQGKEQTEKNERILSYLEESSGDGKRIIRSGARKGGDMKEREASAKQKMGN